jgi:hypothetical protein
MSHVTRAAGRAWRGNGAMAMVVHGLRDLRDRVQAIKTFARIASRALCRMSSSSVWYIFIAWPANRCAVITGT